MSEPTLIFETFLGPLCYKPYQYITEYIERYVKIPAFLLNGEALEDFAAGYADVGFIDTASSFQLLYQHPCPVELIAAALEPGAENSPTFLDIVVRADSPLVAVSDLAGCTWAVHTHMAHVEDNCAAMPARDCAAMIETTTQAQALRLVLQGKADAAAIDARLLDIALRNSPSMTAQLRVLSTYCASPGPLVIVANHVTPSIKQKLQEAFLTIHQHPFYMQRLQEGSIARFLPVSKQHYQREYANAWEEQATTYTTDAGSEIHVSASVL